MQDAGFQSIKTYSKQSTLNVCSTLSALDKNFLKRWLAIEKAMATFKIMCLCVYLNK